MENYKIPDTVEESVNRLKKACDLLENEYHYSKSEFYYPAPFEEIKKLEERLGHKLPEDYIEFLQNTNGAEINGNSFRSVYDAEEDEDYPEEYLIIAELIGDGERLALSKKDGKIYSLYNERIKETGFGAELEAVLRRCEEYVYSFNKKKEKEARRAVMTPEEIAKENAEIEADLEEFDKQLEEFMRNK